jgi:hypothetical protein
MRSQSPTLRPGCDSEDGRSVSDVASAGPAAGRRVGDDPRPRALFAWSGPNHDRVAEVLAQHAPTVREIDHVREIRQADYDLLVTNLMGSLTSRFNGPGTPPDEHLFVVSFMLDGEQDGHVIDSLHLGSVRIRSRIHHLAQSIEVPDDLPEALEHLIGDDLVPAALSRAGHHPYFEMLVSQRAGLPETPPRFRPFLLTTPPGPRVLAGCYPRSASSEGWALPDDLRRPWDWVAAAVRHWAVTYGRFPLVGGWWEDQRWQTRPEVAASSRRTALRAELAAVTSRLETELADASGELDAAVRDAAIGLRRLLTEKGDPLKEAVAGAFTQLGYVVTDRDAEEPPDPGGRIEDLGVTDPDDPGFDPIVEVKGYDSGARAGDFGSMMRHLVRAISNGRSPTAIWWVANTWRKRPPDDRRALLAGEEPMIAEHAGEDVPLVVIDTRDLFRAVRAVEDDLVTSMAVRASLRACRGRWVPPTPTSSSGGTS